MSVALLMAIRIQDALAEIRALKARDPADVDAEQRLTARMRQAMDLLLEQIEQGVAERGLPSEDGAAALLLGELTDVEDELLAALADELGDVAAEAIGQVEQAVEAASTKARRPTPDDIGVRPFGMDRALFDTMTRLRDRMLERFTSRTVDALVSAAEVDLPPTQLRATLGEMLEGELSQLSRHAVGDVRGQATEVAERNLGVGHHRWVTAGDDQVREAHAEVHGEVVAVGELFSNGWRRPGGLGCRCYLEPVPDPEVARVA